MVLTVGLWVKKKWAGCPEAPGPSVGNWWPWHERRLPAPSACGGTHGRRGRSDGREPNGKELGRLGFSTNGFVGHAQGGAGFFLFSNRRRTNAFTVNVRAGDAWGGCLSLMLSKTKGEAEAEAAFDAAKSAQPQFDEFLREFKQDLSLPIPERARRLRPIFPGPLSSVHVCELKAAGFARRAFSARRPVRGSSTNYELQSDAMLDP
jgi:hypothetical protein